MKKKFSRGLSLLLVTAMVGGQVLPAQAAMVGTDTLLEQQQSQMNREQLVQLLDRDAVQQRLAAMGVDVTAAKDRVARMTDSQVAELNAKLGEMPAGGDALGVIFLVFLIFVITDVIGATDIFPFIHPVK